MIFFVVNIFEFFFAFTTEFHFPPYLWLYVTQLVSLGTRLKSFHRLACVTIIDNSEALRLTWFQTFVLSSTDSCQNRVYANQYHMTGIAGSDVNFSKSLVFELFSWLVISCKFITGSFQVYFLGEKAVFYYRPSYCRCSALTQASLLALATSIY